MITINSINNIGQRAVNQDRYSCLKYGNMQGQSVWCLAVFDGMGGLENGEIYAEEAVRLVARRMGDLVASAEQRAFAQPNSDFKTAFDELVCSQKEDFFSGLNREMLDLADRNEYGDGGTTASLAMIMDNTAYLFNTGDSPLYLLRADGVRTEELSIRDNAAERDVREGKTERNTEEYYRKSSGLLSFLGCRSKEVVTHFSKITLEVGDALLIGTDGAFGNELTGSERLGEFLAQNPCVSQIHMALTQRAAETTGDNQTLLVAEYYENTEQNSGQASPSEPVRSSGSGRQKKGWFGFGR